MTDDELADHRMHARRASSFGASAAEYAAHRPDYPSAAIEWALAPAVASASSAGSAGLSTASTGRQLRVLDLGAGTGKLTEGIRALGHTVFAIEPDAAMLAQLTAARQDVRALRGAAEAIGLRTASMDAVLVGQALHWFDQSYAIPEVVRVLRPGGVFAALWNRNDDATEWLVRLNELSRSAMPIDMPTTARKLPQHPLLSARENAQFAHSHRRTSESLLATFGTHSHVLVLPPAQRTDVLRRMREHLNSTQETASGEFEVPMRTEVIRYERAK